MDSLERELREATAQKTLPGVLLAAASIDGTQKLIIFIKDGPNPVAVSR
jgi:hypothetical protein